jgi:hypothetical protein
MYDSNISNLGRDYDYRYDSSIGHWTSQRLGSASDEGLQFDAASFPALLPSSSHTLPQTGESILGNSLHQRGPQPPLSRGLPPQEDSKPDSVDGRYGLMGLLEVIRMSDVSTVLSGWLEYSSVVDKDAHRSLTCYRTSTCSRWGRT